MGISSKILEMSKSQFVSNDQIQALKEISFHSNILKFKEKNLDFKNLSGHAKISQKAKIIKDLIYSGESNFGRQVLVTCQQYRVIKIILIETFYLAQEHERYIIATELQV